MSSTSKAWIVAASLAAVEALKDQGFCRWNYTKRSLQQHANNNLRSTYAAAQTNKLYSQCSSAVTRARDDQKAKQSEESMRKVMYLSCWGPN